MSHALNIGSPPLWEDAPAEFQVAERFMLRKAQAADLLKWRGHFVTPG